MVQIIEGRQKQPSFLESLGAGFGQALPGAVNEWAQGRKQDKQMQQQAQQILAENEQLKKMGIDLSGIQDPKMRQAAFAEIIKGQQKEKLFDKKKKSYSDLLGANQEQPSNISDELMQGEANQGLDSSKFSDESILEASLLDPSLGRAMGHLKDVERREKTEERKMEQQEKLANRKATAPLIEDIIKKGNAANTAIKTKQGLMDIIDRGDMADPTWAAIADAMPFNLGKRMLSDDTTTYKAAMVDDFQGLTNTFPGAIRVKELEIWEDKLANTYLTDSQKKAILKNRINSLQADVIRQEAAEHVAENFPDVAPIKFNKLVNEETKKRTQAIGEIAKDEINSVLNQAEMRKNIPLDLSDADDAKIMKQILMDAGGNKEKALELAKKKGYSFKGYQYK